MSDPTDRSRPPAAYRRFTARFPKAGQAWDLLSAAGAEAGSLDLRTQRLVKFAVAIGAYKEGAAHSAVRKALAAGATREDLEQVVALAASTIGLPAAVAAQGWILDVTEAQAG